tara:strand:- start:436 stop:717 length:282 start_codon:yes stop_codon:yes gene_type:complete
MTERKSEPGSRDKKKKSHTSKYHSSGKGGKYSFGYSPPCTHEYVDAIGKCSKCGKRMGKNFTKDRGTNKNIKVSQSNINAKAAKRMNKNQKKR